LGEPGIGGLPNDKGFDEFFGFLNQQHAHEHYPRYLWRNKTKEVLKGNLGGKKREYASDLMLREALHFIDRHRYEPFLLYFTPTVPHAHFEAPELGEYASKAWPEEAKHYAAMVTRFDSYVGKILDKLEETGMAQNTVVFCTSDNGGTFGYEPFGVTGPLRGKKGSIYEGGHRVPMLVRWPGKVGAGSVSGYAWGFVDFLATCAELAEARGVPRNTDGVSVVPALLGKVRERKEPLYWEAYGGKGIQQAARMGKWKGVRQGLDGKLELYDLAEDAGEKRDVSAENPAVVARMETYLRGCRVESEEYPAGQV
jgi:arylsulfatase A-like enzyme